MDQQMIDSDGFDALKYSKPQTRHQSRLKQVFLNTWLDDDESGNYDPVEEQRHQRLKKSRMKASIRPRAVVQEDPTRTEAEHINASVTPTALLILRFTEKKQQFKGIISSVEAKALCGEAGHKLRNRNEVRRASGCVTHDKTVDPDTVIDLNAKPFARGCWGCARLVGLDGQTACSLVNDERHWPCQTCAEDGIDCELIISPIRKRACELCKRRRIVCSYTTTRNHDNPCQQCVAVQHSCIAGPVKEYIKPRARYDRDWMSDPLPRLWKNGKCRVSEDCIECYVDGSTCLYPPHHVAGPCVNCKRLHLPCTISMSQPEKHTKLTHMPKGVKSPRLTQLTTCTPVQTTKISQAKIDEVGMGNLRADSNLKTDARTQGMRRAQGKPRQIYTSFSHPIVFNCDREDHPRPGPCHFCQEPLFSVYGFGEVRVDIIDYCDGRGFIEVSDTGHANQGIQNTRLCTVCTTERMAILCCDAHQLCRRPETRHNCTAFVAPAEDKAEESWLLANVNGLCKLCRSLAVYECEVEQDGHTGCGLRLCERCATMLLNFRGDLQCMLSSVDWKVGSKRRPDVRADVEFFRATGSLCEFLKSPSFG